MPRPGGMAAKLGDRYEGRWTLLQLLRVLNEEADLIRVEIPGLDAVEFALVVKDKIEYHQVRRQRAEGSWTIANLSEVLAGFKERLANANAVCVFVSMQAADELDELAERAKGATSGEEFAQHLVTSHKVETTLKRLAKTWEVASLADLWDYLRRIHVEAIREQHLVDDIRRELRLLVAGDPVIAQGVLIDYIDDHLSVELYAHSVWQHLQDHGFRRAHLGVDPRAVAAVQKQNERYRRSVQDIAIGERFVPRVEADEIIRLLRDPEGPKSIFVVAGSGYGKSGVLRQVVEALVADKWPILALRADSLSTAATAAELGEGLNMPGSPGIVIAAMPSDRQRLFLIDQLDAVSTSTGRRVDLFQPIKEMLDEVADFPAVRVLVACREFDLNNDRRLRRLLEGAPGGVATIHVKGLPEGVVRKIIEELEISTDRLPQRLELLSVPLHLSLLADVARTKRAQTLDLATPTDLFTEFWEVKQQKLRESLGRDPRWKEVIETLCQAIDDERSLWVPHDILDRMGMDADAMVSAGVLRRRDEKISFFHESFFDYAFARLFAGQGQRLVDYLGERDQHLFRRSQVRQILAYERETRPERYVADLAELLGNSGIRFHLKEVAISLLTTFKDATAMEWEVLQPLLNAGDKPLRERIVGLLRASPEWFELLVANGFMASWMRSEDEQWADRSADVLISQERRRPALVAKLLRECADRTGRWQDRLRFIVSVADISADREFFDLAIELIDDGTLDDVRPPTAVNSDFWSIGYSLKQRPAWIAEFAEHYFNRQLQRTKEKGTTNPFSDTAGGIPDSQTAPGLLLDAARADPRSFAVAILPFVAEVMRANVSEDQYHDSVWRFRTTGEVFGISQAVLRSVQEALQALGAIDDPAFRELASDLRSIPMDTADFLLLSAYGRTPASNADRAVELLLEEPRRLNQRIVAATLIRNSSTSCSGEKFEQLERAVMQFYPEHERSAADRGRYGATQYVLLNALDPQRLSTAGKRRLEELRRKFMPITPADEDFEFRGGFLHPPIPTTAVEKMGDENWLQAFRRYSGPAGFSADDILKGGARELADLFEHQFPDDPARFAKLAASLPNDLLRVYYQASIRGTTSVLDKLDPTLVWEVCRQFDRLTGRPFGKDLLRLIEHAAALDVPKDLLEMVARYAIDDEDPREDDWRREAYSGHRVLGGSVLLAGLNSTRGTAALAIAAILSADHSKLEHLEDAVESLVRDRTSAARACAVRPLLVLIGIDEARARALFEALIAGCDDTVLATQDAQRFVNYILHREPLRVLAVIRRMLASSDEQVAYVGAELATMAWLLYPDHDNLRKEAEEAGPAARAGCARIYAGNVTNLRFRARCAGLLMDCFDDQDKRVRESAVELFWQLSSDDFEVIEDVCLRFLDSGAYSEHSSRLIHELEQSRANLASVVAKLAQRFVAEAGRKASDIRFAEAGNARIVSGLLVRNYSSATTEAERNRSLDLIDQMFEIGAFGVGDSLADYER
jgi:hypothetical protein